MSAAFLFIKVRIINIDIVKLVQEWSADSILCYTVQKNFSKILTTTNNIEANT